MKTQDIPIATSPTNISQRQTNMLLAGRTLHFYKYRVVANHTAELWKWVGSTTRFHCCLYRPLRSDDGGGLMRKRDKDPGQKSDGVAQKQLQFNKQPLLQRIGKLNNKKEDILRNSYLRMGRLNCP